MDVKLVIEQGRTRTREVCVRRAETVVGRAPGCGLRISSAQVSRRHCVLRIQDDTVTVEDLGSSNGTQVNGRPTRGRHVIQPGDRLRVGPLTFLVEFRPPRARKNLLLQEALPKDVLPEAEELEEVDQLPLAALDEEDDLPTAEPIDDTDDLAPLQVDEEDCLPELDADTESDDPQGWSRPNEDDMRDLLAGLDDAEDRPPDKKR